MLSPPSLSVVVQPLNVTLVSVVTTQVSSKAGESTSEPCWFEAARRTAASAIAGAGLLRGQRGRRARGELRSLAIGERLADGRVAAVVAPAAGREQRAEGDGDSGSPRHDVSWEWPAIQASERPLP